MAEHVLFRVREAAELGLPVSLTRPEAEALAAEMARLLTLARAAEVRGGKRCRAGRSPAREMASPAGAR